MKYNKDADVKYVISDDSALTPLEEYVEEYKKLMDQLYKEGKVNNWASRESLMKYMYEHLTNWKTSYTGSPITCHEKGYRGLSVPY